MKTKLLSILTFFTLSVGVNAQNVNIPDANFKTYLVNNHTINTNQDTEIQVSEAVAFTGSIDCGNRSISDLTGIEEFPNIVELICDRNNLTTINISNNTALTLLNVDRNSLTNLDASANAALYHLYAQRNQLSTISTNSALAGGLYLAYNNFTTLDVSNNTALTELACQNNALTTLDVSANSSLFGLYCQDNALTSLNVANGSNTGMGFNATNNPNLTCIEVDNVAWSTTNWTNIDATASYSTNCPPPTCTVNIPDANFKAYLVGNTSINTNNDSEIQCSEATAFTGTINCEWLSISDLTGLEAFVNLTELNIEGNSLINLDLSANTALTILNANINNLTSLNVSAITTLIELNCIDNNLTSLDVSNNTNLDILKVYNNELTSLNVTANTALTDLECNGNYITSLDVSNNLNLIWLITGNNNITSLDLSANTSLIYLECQVNELTSLNIANGNNNSFGPSDFDATSNPNLTCIQVDNVAYSTTNWTNIDAVASFSTNCSTCIVNIPDANFKAYLVGNTSINTNNDTEIQCSEATAYTGLINCASLSISDLTGIEAFINITDLFCNDNNLTSIDISAIPNLGGLDCSDNQLTSLNTSLNTSLYSIRCANNALTSIDLSTHPNINTLYCNGNNITTLNLSNLTTLYDLNCSDNQITSIDASNIPLQYFECQNNALTSLNVANGNNYNIVDFDATNNPNLTCIQVDDVAYSNSNWSLIDSASSFSTNCAPCTVNIPDVNFKANLVANTALNTNGDTEIQCSEATAFTGEINVQSASVTDMTGLEAFTAITSLKCNNNQLTVLDVSNNTALTILHCQSNQLTALDVSANTSLVTLVAFLNNITAINVSSNTALETLSLGYNDITSLDVSANTAMKNLYVDYNAIPVLNVASMSNLERLTCGDNLISTLDVSNSPQLVTLECFTNQLTSLDVSNNLLLTRLACGFNQISSLDLSANTALNFMYCQSNGMTSLNIANGNNSNIPNTSFVAQSNPNLTCIQVDDVSYSNANWSLIDSASSFSTNCGTCVVNIPDAAFKAYLVANNAINTNGDTEIQCTEASAFNGTINCNTLSISDLTGIEAFTALTKLYCYSNQITSLDVSANTALTYLVCYGNQLTSLDLSTNTALTYLNYNNNQIANLDISNNTALEYLFCNNNQITSLDVSTNTALVKLSCTTNQLTSLDVSANTALIDLNCSVNQLTSLDVSANTALTKLYCGNNQITALDLSANTALENLFCNNNQLTSLNIANTNNTSIINMFADNNPNLACIEVDNVAYSTTNWTNIDAAASFSTNCGALSIDDFTFNKVSIYPNPTTSVLNIKMNSNLKRATIYSILGATILETTSKNITTSNLKNGIYLIRIEDEDGSVSTKKFMKK